MFSIIKDVAMKHVKTIVGFVAALVALFIFFTTGVINSTMGLLGIQANVGNLINMGSLVSLTGTANIANITNIGQAAPLDILVGTISWLLDLVLRTIVMVVDKITVAVDMIFRLINMLYQMAYQFLHQSITAIIDRCIEFYARKPWGSISDTPLAMRTRQRMETYFSIKSRKIMRRIKNQADT